MTESKGSAETATRLDAGSARTKDASLPKTSTKAGKTPTRRANPFARLVRFIREVVAELRKVIWPTRKELITYTTVVLVFLIIMVTIVWLMDYGFAKAVLFLFSSGNSEGGQ